MKLLFYIAFAFYFTALSAMPCSDTDNCNEPKHTEQTAQNDKHGGETCPPLCHCTCCGTTFVINTCELPGLGMIEIKKICTAFSAQLPAGIPAAVWQPPKTA